MFFTAKNVPLIFMEASVRFQAEEDLSATFSEGTN